MSETTTIASSCKDSSHCFNMKHDIEISSCIIKCSNDSSSSNSDSAQRCINISTDETQVTASECIRDMASQNLKENVDDSHVLDVVSEQNIVVKIELADSLAESHSSIPSNVLSNDTLQPSVGGFTFKTEKQCFNSLDDTRSCVLQPIVYDNEKNCSYNQEEFNQTHLYHSQQFQRTQHPFQPQVSALQQFTINNQTLPNAFQGLSSNSNRKYSNAFQLILNGFQPHINGGQIYVNAHDLHSGVAQFNSTEGIQPSLNERQLPIGLSSYPNNNPSSPSDFHQHPLGSLAQLTASQSSSTSSKLQSCKSLPFSSPVQPSRDKPSPNDNQQLSGDNLSQSTSTSMKSQQNGSLPFPGVNLMQPNGNKPSKYYNQQLLLDSLRNDKTTLVDVIAPLEKYFRGDTCLLCGFKSSAKRLCSARKHLVTHLHKRDFKCGICGKGFVSPEYQLLHEKTHSNSKDLTFQCRLCDGKFRSRERLSKHEKTHDGVKLQCPLCDMQLATRVSLKSHLTIHTGELPYQCSTCSKKFRTTDSLRLHVLKHTGVKRFTCDICGKGFNRSSMYKQHLGTHEGGAAFQCDKCEKTFNFRSNLAQHRKTHSEDRAHECGECGKKFKFPHHLRSHMATHGPIIKTE